MKHIFIFLSLFFVAISQASALKIGYININHVISNSPQFIQANQNVIKEFKPQEDELIKLNEKLKTLIAKFNSNKDSLTKAKADKKIKNIAALDKKIKNKASSLQEKLEVRNKQELGEIQRLINQAIKETAENDKFDLILYQEVAYASKDVNITQIISNKLRQLFE